MFVLEYFFPHRRFLRDHRGAVPEIEDEKGADRNMLARRAKGPKQILIAYLIADHVKQRDDGIELALQSGGSDIAALTREAGRFRARAGQRDHGFAPFETEYRIPGFCKQAAVPASARTQLKNFARRYAKTDQQIVDVGNFDQVVLFTIEKIVVTPVFAKNAIGQFPGPILNVDGSRPSKHVLSSSPA